MRKLYWVEITPNNNIKIPKGVLNIYQAIINQ